MENATPEKGLGRKQGGKRKPPTLMDTAVDTPLEALKRLDETNRALNKVFRVLTFLLRREDLPMGVKEDLNTAIDDLDTAITSNEVTHQQKLDALQAQIDLLSANPSETDVRAAIQRLTAEKERLLAAGPSAGEGSGGSTGGTGGGETGTGTE